MHLLVNIFEKALSSELFHTKASLSFPMVLENYFFSPIVTSFPFVTVERVTSLSQLIQILWK